MCTLIWAWLCVMLGLLPLEIQTRTLPLEIQTRTLPLEIQTRTLPLEIQTRTLPLEIQTRTLPLEIQTRTLKVQTLAHRLRHQPHLLPDLSPAVPSQSPLKDNRLPQPEGALFWRALLHKDPLPTHHHAHRAPEEGGAPDRPRGSRGRRHVNSVGGRAHLMRVGCVLGTCQVQNLSHRLYQLIGQSGREDSSPINPRSPHSYG